MQSLDGRTPRRTAFVKTSDSAWLYCLVVLLPCLGAVAGYYDNRDLLLLVYLMAGLSVFMAYFRMQEKSADRIYPLLLVAVALSLLLSGTLFSAYIPHNDIRVEFMLFQQVDRSGLWTPTNADPYNSALSVTILPSVVNIVSSIDGTTVFKVIYPSLFAIVPLLLYKIYRNIMAPIGAFVSAFVFLFFPGTFLETPVVARQMIAELIIVLLFWLLISPEFGKTRLRTVLVIFLTLGLVISHYSVALIYIFLIAFSLVAARIIPRFRRVRLFGNINLLAISLVSTVAWFIFIAGGIVLANLTASLSGIITNLPNLFKAGATPLELYQALGVTGVNFSILHLANRAIQYLVVLCLIIGFAVYLRKRPSNPRENSLVLLTLASMCFLAAAVFLPSLANLLNLSRIYSITLLLLSPCFYFGAEAIVAGFVRMFGRVWALLGRKPVRIRVRMRIGWKLPATILFLYLIFASGWVWAVTLDTPTSLVLDGQRMENSPNRTIQTAYFTYYVLPHDVAGAQWISSNTVTMVEICADVVSQRNLASYAGYEAGGPVFHGKNVTVPGSKGAANGDCNLNDYVYVSLMNIVTGTGTGGHPESENTLSGRQPYLLTDVNGTLVSLLAQNRVYSDGSVIYVLQHP